MSIRRQDIVSAIQTRFQTITTVSYHTNLGSNVFIWKASTIEAISLPALVIRDVINVFTMEGEGVPYSYHTQTLSFEVSLIVDSGSSSDTFIRQAIQDVYKAVGVDDTWGGLALTSFMRDDEIIFDDQKENKIIGASIKFDVLYRTNKYQENLA